MIAWTLPLATAPGTAVHVAMVTCIEKQCRHYSCQADHTPILTLRSMHVPLIALMLNKKTIQGQIFKLCEPLAWGPEVGGGGGGNHEPGDQRPGGQAQ